MTEEQALLAAIRENPGEDTPRLVYADWLDENPTPKRQARAEFIRAQVAYSHLGPLVPTAELVAEAKAHLDRAAALLKKWGAGWIPRRGRREAGQARADVRDTVVRVGGFSPGIDYRFERGFIEELGIEFAPPAEVVDFSHAVETLAAHPLSRTTFGILGYAPTVVVKTRRVKGELWELIVGAGDEELGEKEFVVFGGVFHQRAELVRQVPTILAAHLPQIDFEQIHDDDDGGYGEEGYDVPF